jgi:cytidine deaminase
MTDRSLLEAAGAVMDNAYSPYSNLKVGAAIECSDGSVFTGCNVENVSYGVTMCAEAAAVAAAVSTGKRAFKRIAIISSGSNYCYPCGSCLQMLREFSQDMEVLSARGDGRYVSYTLKTHLPMAFGKE